MSIRCQSVVFDHLGSNTSVTSLIHSSSLCSAPLFLSFRLNSDILLSICCLTLLARLQTWRDLIFSWVCLSVCMSVCLSVCLSLALLPFNADRFWQNFVTRTLQWSSLAATIMVQTSHRVTAWRGADAFLKISKNSQKSQNLNFKILVHHFCVCVSCVSYKNLTRFEQNWRRRYILKSAPIAITQVWTWHPVQCYVPPASTACLLQRPTRCGVPVAQQTTPFAAGKVWHRRTAKRYVQKLDIGHVHKFGMECVRKFGIWARS